MRILFVSNPLRGHLNTLLPLALVAQSAGHHVVIASGPNVQQHVEYRGLLAWPVGPTHAQLGGSRQTSALTNGLRKPLPLLSVYVRFQRYSGLTQILV